MLIGKVSALKSRTCHSQSVDPSPLQSPQNKIWRGLRTEFPDPCYPENGRTQSRRANNLWNQAKVIIKINLQSMESQNLQNFPAFIISSILITLFLFYLIEGALNFNWMSSFGNWFLFLIYSGSILIGQVWVSLISVRRVKGKSNTILSILGGTALSLTLLVFVIF